LCKQLASKEGVDYHIKDSCGYNVCHKAMCSLDKRGSKEVVEILNYLVDELLVDITLPTLSGSRCLSFAVVFVPEDPGELEERLKLIKTLVEKYNVKVDAVDDGKMTCLHLSKLPQFSELLLKYNPEMIHMKSKLGDTSLHFAVASNHPTVEFLSKQPQININIRNNKGRTPLHFALQYHQYPTAFNLILAWC
jgi:hypothetical protein